MARVVLIVQPRCLNSPLNNLRHRSVREGSTHFRVAGDRPEGIAVRDACNFLPCFPSPYRTRFMFMAVGNTFSKALTLLVGFGLPQPHPQSVFSFSDAGQTKLRQFRASECSSKAEQDEGAVALVYQ